MSAFSDAIGASTRDIREVIRDVVREELRKLRPAASHMAFLSIAEAVREEIQRTLRSGVHVIIVAQEKLTVSYAAVA